MGANPGWPPGHMEAGPCTWVQGSSRSFCGFAGTFGLVFPFPPEFQNGVSCLQSYPALDPDDPEVLDFLTGNSLGSRGPWLCWGATCLVDGFRDNNLDLRNSMDLDFRDLSSGCKTRSVDFEKGWSERGWCWEWWCSSGLSSRVRRSKSPSDLLWWKLSARRRAKGRLLDPRAFLPLWWCWVGAPEMKKADFTMDFFTKQCYVFLEFYLPN